MRLDGSDLKQITKGGGYLARASDDGKYLVYFKRGALWKVPAEGGEEEEIVPNVSGFLNFTLTHDAIYYIPKPPPDGSYWIYRYDLATKAQTAVINISFGPQLVSEVAPDDHLFFMKHGLTLSPDGHTLLWAQTDQRGSDLMLAHIQ